MNPLALVRALRPQQWTKNLFVLAAPLFAYGDRRSALPREALTATLWAFVGFCLAASAVYLINDVFDAEKDRRHPTKRLRPIAAGEVSFPLALASALACWPAPCSWAFGSTAARSASAGSWSATWR